MKCDDPHIVTTSRGDRVPVPCGRCPPCKQRRVNEWVFRLMQEDKNSVSAHFVTLTYDTRYVPISDNGFMTLKKSDFQDFMKRLRFNTGIQGIKYYAVGEYGSKNKRPHFHAIIFNVEDKEQYFKAWSVDGNQFGTVHVGTVTGDSIAYTMKYIDKPGLIKKFSRDDRVPEFSLMSKGLGLSYLSPAIVQYHKERIGELYVTKLSGHKCSMPRYYRKRIFTPFEQEQQLDLVQAAVHKAEIDDRRDWQLHYSHRMTYDEYCDKRRLGRFTKFYHSQKSRNV